MLGLLIAFLLFDNSIGGVRIWKLHIFVRYTFFFGEVDTCWYINQEKGKSSKTKDIISVGTHSNQIWEEKDCLAC